MNFVEMKLPCFNWAIICSTPILWLFSAPAKTKRLSLLP